MAAPLSSSSASAPGQPPQLPTHHRALHLTSTNSPLAVVSRPTPHAGPGSAVVRILAASVLSYSGEICNGTRNYPFPTPMVPGASAVGRVVAVGRDATVLAPGQLVLCDCTVRGRDNPDEAIFLSGISEGFSARSKKLMHDAWRDSTYAELARMPLENCIALNEKRLLGELGYTVEELLALSTLAVPFGGLDDVGAAPGETIVVAPSTGKFGAAAVRVALAMGAGRVIAMGRNQAALERLAIWSSRVSTVQISGDAEKDAEAMRAWGPVDVFFDISPPMAAGSGHVRGGIDAVRWGGRVSLMGGVRDDLAFNYISFMHRNLTLKGTWMYTREQLLKLVKMAETGVLPLGDKGGFKLVGKFGLEQWQEAFDTAAKNAGPGESVVLVP